MALPIVRMNTRGLFPMRDVKLSDKYTIDEGTVLMTGTHALVRLPMLQKERDTRAGLDTGGFISGYRGSPLGSYDQELWRAKDLLESMDVLFQPGVNEDLAATAVWGTQMLAGIPRSEEHTSELQSLMRTPHAVFCVTQ